MIVRSFPTGSDATIKSRTLRVFFFGRSRIVVDAAPDVVSPDLDVSSEETLRRLIR